MSHTAVAGRAWRSGAEAGTVCACAGAARENAAAAMIDASGRSDLAIIASPSAVNPVRGQRKSGFGPADAAQPVGDRESARRAMFEPVANRTDLRKGKGWAVSLDIGGWRTN